jgi:hypothetical protein
MRRRKNDQYTCVCDGLQKGCQLHDEWSHCDYHDRCSPRLWHDRLISPGTTWSTFSARTRRISLISSRDRGPDKFANVPTCRTRVPAQAMTSTATARSSVFPHPDTPPEASSSSSQQCALRTRGRPRLATRRLDKPRRTPTALKAVGRPRWQSCRT